MDEVTNSADMQEVTVPAVNEGEEVQELAEPAETQGKTKADSAFAQMRREKEDALSRAEEAERKLAEQEARANAIRNLSGREDAVEMALAESLGLDEDEVTAKLDAATESAKKDIEIEELRNYIDGLEVDRRMAEDLREIQTIDPSVKSLDELGDVFIDLIEAGASAKAAYYAAKAEEINERATPPKPIGKVDATAPEKDFFTEAEVDAMTPEQQAANWEKIKKSMTKW